MFWLIVSTDVEGGEPEPLNADVPGRGRALAVFSFEEEARMYLWLRAPRGRWRVEEVAVEKLASMLLSGARSRVGWIALDPIPEPSYSLAVSLGAMSREGFLGFLSVSQARPRTPPPGVGSGIESETARRRE